MEDGGPTLIVPRRIEDARGWFSETWSSARLGELGITTPFVQENQSYSAEAGTVRGLHFQRPPHAQAKLVSCLDGAITDVVVDLRRGSATFGRHVSVTLTAQGGEQLYVPVGMAHGFITRTPGTRVVYRVSAGYAPSSEGGLAWDDTHLNIDWGLEGRAPVLSTRDTHWPRLSNLATPFVDDGISFRLREVRL